jgi:hypothetical protein
VITNSKRVLALAGTAIAIAIPAAASAAPPAERGGSSQAVAVRACVEYRQLIGHDTFRAAFGNLKGCVAMVVPTTIG